MHLTKNTINGLKNKQEWLGLEMILFKLEVFMIRWIKIQNYYRRRSKQTHRLHLKIYLHGLWMYFNWKCGSKCFLWKAIKIIERCFLCIVALYRAVEEFTNHSGQTEVGRAIIFAFASIYYACYITSCLCCVGLSQNCTHNNVIR